MTLTVNLPEEITEALSAAVFMHRGTLLAEILSKANTAIKEAKAKASFEAQAEAEARG
jgi:hypothetical protein